MKSNRRLPGTLLTLITLAGGLAACGQIEDTAAALEASKITMIEAIKAAKTGALADGTPTEVELKMIDGQPRYNVELVLEGGVTSVAVDGVSGEVLETAVVELDVDEQRIIDELMLVDAEQRLGLQGALKEAMKNTENGRPVEVDLEEQEGELVYDIRLLVGNLIQKEIVKIRQ